MTNFLIPISDTAVPGEYLPGSEIPFHLPIQSFGNATEDDIHEVRISIYRFDGSGNKQYQKDANGTTVQDLKITDTIQATNTSPITYFYRYETPDDIGDGLYLLEWVVKLSGFDDQNIIDRFRVAASRTDLIGDVDFVGTRTV